MALIDVSDILNDPDFSDDMTLIHRSTLVNDLGENVLSERATFTRGVVQPASGKAIERLPEAMRLTNIMSFWTRAPIIADKNGGYSDIILFKGNRYQVNSVQDWTTWGVGYTEGTCVMENPSNG